MQTGKIAEGYPYPNLLNLVWFDELDCTDQEFTCINGLTGHSTRCIPKHAKKVFFGLQFIT